MYNVKGPSKIVAKTARRGFYPFFNMENWNCSGPPKPIFQNVSKKSNQQRAQDSITPQHEEIIKYINESWNSIYSEVKHANDSPYYREKQTIYYKDDPCPSLQNFKPFDLEAWWGKRLYTYITNSVNTKG
ncbi:fam195 family [Holotrichia oblita]|uniref:Fam195 family n=1 Tax=Holotrichia oblita TaxID=644536 RepID=A0ACB9TZB9_HOLOL|nr:fam195 family [Holotrichia oblita]